MTLSAIETMRKGLDEMDDITICEQLELAAASVEANATPDDLDAVLASMLWREAARRLRMRASNLLVRDLALKGTT